jgi:3-hydroxyisobutyrate dehydrogenase-like beta-hydroxyacid dehydrogenase
LTLTKRQVENIKPEVSGAMGKQIAERLLDRGHKYKGAVNQANQTNDGCDHKEYAKHACTKKGCKHKDIRLSFITKQKADTQISWGAFHHYCKQRMNTQNKGRMH